MEAQEIRNPSWTTKSNGGNVEFTADGTAVYLYVLEDDGIEVAIMNYGARILYIRTPDPYGNMANVVLSYSALDGYVTDVSSHLGAVVGRYANRIAAGNPDNGRTLAVSTTVSVSGTTQLA